jgi:dihydroorotase-like cyclic amidohydrolase
VETLLPLMFTEVMRGRLGLARLAALCAANPARILGLPGKGRIAVGCDADLVIVDPDRRERLQAHRLHAKAGWTPFEGREVRGLPTVTILRGVVISEKGEFVGRPGTGRMIRPARGRQEI